MDKYKTTKVSITQYFFEIWAILNQKRKNKETQNSYN